MEFWKVILGLIRRKRLVLPLLVAATTLGIAGGFLTPLKYISSATMVLVTPAFGGTLSQDPADPTDLTNPLLNFNDNLKTASAILIYAMNTPEVAAELGTLDGPTELTIDDGRTNPDLILNNGPFIYIVGKSASKTEAREVVLRAQERMRQELIDRQKALRAPLETYVTMDDVVAASIPEASRADRVKVGSIAFVLALVLGLSAVYAWQRLRVEGLRPDRDERSVQDEKSEPHWSWGWVAESPETADSGLEDSSAARITNTLGERGDSVHQVTVDHPRAASAVTVVPPPKEKSVSPEQQDTNGHPTNPAEQATNGHPTNPAEQATNDKRATGRAKDWDQIATGVQGTADEAQTAEADQSVGPELATYPDEQVDTAMRWNLYFAVYPPTDGQHPAPAPNTANDESDLAWNWDLHDVNSERISQ
jgi:hypothetical protein